LFDGAVLFFGSLLVFGGWFFYVFAAVMCFWISFIVDEIEGLRPTILAVVALLAIYFLGNSGTIKSWFLDWSILWYIGGYFLGGFIWSWLKWVIRGYELRFALNKIREDYSEPEHYKDVTDMLNARFSQYWVENRYNERDARGRDKKTALEEYLAEKTKENWNDYLWSRLQEHKIYRKFNFYRNAMKTLVPSVRSNMARVVNWGMLWPFDIAGMFFRDWLRSFWIFVVEIFSGFYQKFMDKIIGGMDKMPVSCQNEPAGQSAVGAEEPPTDKRQLHDGN
jgi:hypothetical protein